MANCPQELAQDAVCQSHTGHMTVLWFLPARPLRLNTNEWMTALPTEKEVCRSSRLKSWGWLGMVIRLSTGVWNFIIANFRFIPFGFCERWLRLLPTLKIGFVSSDMSSEARIHKRKDTKRFLDRFDREDGFSRFSRNAGDQRWTLRYGSNPQAQSGENHSDRPLT